MPPWFSVKVALSKHFYLHFTVIFSKFPYTISETHLNENLQDKKAYTKTLRGLELENSIINEMESKKEHPFMACIWKPELTEKHSWETIICSVFLRDVLTSQMEKRRLRKDGDNILMMVSREWIFNTQGFSNRTSCES